MACCLDIGIGAAANVVASPLKKVVQVVKMVISLPQALSDMEAQVQRLNDVINGINVELARVDMDPKSIVDTWLKNAGEAIERSRSIRSDYDQHKNYISCCPNCLCRYRIGKHIRDWKGNVDRLHSQRQSDFPPSGEYGDPTPRNQVPIHNPPESGFAANTMRSAQTKLVERWLTDEDSNIRRIGIHGMGGVGKTSLLDTINDSQKVKNSFELIIKLTVSKNHIKDLQNCLADRLKLRDFKDNSNSEERKNWLRSRLLQNKKYLLLLDDMWADDMWTSDELQELGVSLNDTGFKIVLTTRDKEVCTRMNVQETITVEPLLEDEGWQLFRSRAFENQGGNAPPELEEVAREIAKKCKGLPLAIIVVAAAMTHHSAPYEWKVALDQMKNVHETFYDLHAGVDKKLFQRLKWSYNVLPNYLKTCFLYFAAYPEDKVILVEEVIDIWVAEGLVQGSGESYLHDIGHIYIKHLKDRCLIEVVTNDVLGRIESVKIHDVLRDLAIRIAEKEHGCYFKAGQGLSHFPSEEDSEGCARMSLMYNRLQSLPTTFRCSSLSVLLLEDNDAIEEVPESFLRELSSLKVLDLRKTRIVSLPPCIANLKHLASLQLSYCKNIRELPEAICDLKQLQFLNVRGCSQLRFLPERISELKSLRALDISYCKRLSHLPRGISQLVTLERLAMMGIRLDFEEEANAEERKYGCLKDLQSLRRLRVLHVEIKSPVKDGVMGNWSKMRDLWLEFSGDWSNNMHLPQDMQNMQDLESFSLRFFDVERLPRWVSEFRKLAFLDLYYCKQLKKVPAELPCLRVLRIHACIQLEELELGMGFPKLQELTLKNLESLECVGAVAAASGSGGLGEEESLGCVGAVAAASGSGGLGEGASPLPPMLKSLHVKDCPKLKRLRGGWDKLKCLEVIEGEREWWDAIQWEDPNMKASLQSKFRSGYYNM